MYHFLPLLLLRLELLYLATPSTPCNPPDSFRSLSNNAEFALESSVVFDDEVEFNKSDNCAYEEVEELSEDFGVGGGWPVLMVEDGKWYGVVLLRFGDLDGTG
jgi:hypothetical protein